MKAHTLMQAIARANRVYPGKDFGLIVDYNGMLKSLREALAQYALGDDGDGERGDRRADRGAGAGAPRAIEATEAICASLASMPTRLIGAKGSRGSQALADAVEAVYNAATKPSGGSRSWRGRCSSASRRW